MLRVALDSSLPPFSLSFFLGAWFIEGSRWQISERIAIVLIALVIPLFALEWRFQMFGFGSGKTAAVEGLARLILFLCAVKLFQKKSDRDWVFIYIISFFEVLLAAGLTISPLFLIALFGFLLFIISSVIAFEIRKTSREVFSKVDQIEEPESISIQKRLTETLSLRRLPTAAITLLILITAFAVPLFFALPRVGGAGLGRNLSGGETNVTGFSDSVSLGDIGRLKQNEETVMRVRVEGNGSSAFPKIYWRGVALDTFDNQRWTKSNLGRFDKVIKGANGFFPVNYARKTTGNVSQTFFWSPSALKSYSRCQPRYPLRGISHYCGRIRTAASARLMRDLKELVTPVISDPFIPDVERLQADSNTYSARYRRFLQSPSGFLGPGTGQHTQQRHLGQADGRGSVVDQNDLVAGQRHFVTAAGTGAVDGGQELQATVFR